jgi:hypothetical protein
MGVYGDLIKKGDLCSYPLKLHVMAVQARS